MNVESQLLSSEDKPPPPAKKLGEYDFLVKIVSPEEGSNTLPAHIKKEAFTITVEVEKCLSDGCEALAGSILKMEVDKVWQEQFQYVRIGDSLGAYSVLLHYHSPSDLYHLEVASTSILVIEPSYLISCTSISHVHFCARTIYLRMVAKSTKLNPKAYLGTLLHQTMAYHVKTGVDVESSYLINLADSLDLALTLDIPAANLVSKIKAIEDTLVKLGKIYKNSKAEYVLHSTKYGLIGSADFLDNEKLFEFKTGSSSYGHVRKTHRFQVQAYGLILLERIRSLISSSDYDGDDADSVQSTTVSKKSQNIDSGYDLVVHYIGDKSPPPTGYVEEKIEIKNWTAYQIITLRNQAFAIQRHRIIPTIKSKKDNHACKHCFVRNECFLLCAQRNEFRNCTSCTHEKYCHKQSSKKSVAKYVTTLNKALVLESEIEAKGMKHFFEQSDEANIAEGSSFLLNALDEETIKGIPEIQLILKNFSLIPIEGSEFLSTDGSSLLVCKSKYPINLRKGSYLWMMSTNSSSLATRGRVIDIRENYYFIKSRHRLTGLLYVYRSFFEHNLSILRVALFNFEFQTDSRKQALILQPPDPSWKNEIILNDQYLGPLDVHQRDALKLCLNSAPFTLIEGVPGSGKTTIIAEFVYYLLSTRGTGIRILISADTNNAVDRVVERLLMIAKERHSKNSLFSFNDPDHPLLQRIGKSRSISTHVKEYMIATDPIFALRRQSYSNVIEILRKWLRFPKTNGESNSPSSRNDVDETTTFYEGLKGRLKNITIVAGTTSAIGKAQLEDLYFDYVIIDEAQQIVEPSAINAVIKGKKIILVGDENQLSTQIRSEENKENGSLFSMFHRLSKTIRWNKSTLTKQYRMQDEIYEFSSARFYQDKILSANAQIRSRKLILPKYRYIYNWNKRQQSPRWLLSSISSFPSYMVLEVPGMLKSGVNINFEELATIQIILNQLLRMDIHPQKIGVISPYQTQTGAITGVISHLYSSFRAQVIRYFKTIKHDERYDDIDFYDRNLSSTLEGDISRNDRYPALQYPEETWTQIADTIDGFQGKERDIILFSATNVSTDPEIPSLLNDKNLNVALTRARLKAIILVSPCENMHPTIEELLHDAKQRRCYFKVDRDEISSWTSNIMSRYDSMENVPTNSPQLVIPKST